MSIIAPSYSLPPPLLEPRSRRAFAILEHQVRAQAGVLNYVLLAFLLIIGILPLVLNFYLQRLVGIGLFGTASGLATFFWPIGQGIWFFLLILLVSSVGAAILARDVATKAVTMYLARPVPVSDYLAAKAAAVAFWVFLGGILPGWVGTIMVLALGYVSLPIALQAAGAYLVVGLFCMVAYTGLAALLSSLTARSTLAGAGIFGILLGSDVVMGLLAGISNNTNFLYASPGHDVVAVGSGMFGASGTPLDPWASGIVLAVFGGLALAVTYYRLRRTQVVSE